MTSQVIYRLPHQTKAHECFSSRVPQRLTNFCDLGKAAGYVFAPFCPTAENPILLFDIASEKQWNIPPVSTYFPQAYHCTSLNAQHDYSTAFRQCLHLLQTQQVEKIVLSRSLQIQFAQALTFEQQQQLFIAACHRFANCFIALVRTPQAGIWLTATPEILLEQQSDAPTWRTMALASTMPLNEAPKLHPQQWSSSHLREQHLVSRYIVEQLAALGITAISHETHSKQAGHLQHLCTLFDFSLPTTRNLGEVITALHPTPAVCGLPTIIAQEALSKIEQHDRAYYTGFTGPLQLQTGTHLFVTLRCMQIAQDQLSARLYAGGGLLSSSIEAEEWQETCHKLETLLGLL